MSSESRSSHAVTAPLAVFHIDLVRACEALEAEEAETVRLSSVERARFDQKASALGDHDARLWRTAHIALRITIERYAGHALRGVPFDIEAGGRPRVGRTAQLPRYPEFSLAHAGHDALIAISLNGAVGVDLEVPRQPTISPERRDRIIRAAQLLAPDAALPDDRDARLLQSWVRLEAVAKATGLGIGRVLTEAGVIGRNRHAPSLERATAIDVTDLAIGAQRFAAIAAQGLPQIVILQGFPETQAGLAAFLAGGASAPVGDGR